MILGEKVIKNYKVTITYLAFRASPSLKLGTRSTERRTRGSSVTGARSGAEERRRGTGDSSGAGR
jgi:hypothetical protein